MLVKNEGQNCRLFEICGFFTFKHELAPLDLTPHPIFREGLPLQRSIVPVLIQICFCGFPADVVFSGNGKHKK